MTVGVARKHERQSAVARNVARGAEAILQSEYGKHERRGSVAEPEHARDKAERRHNGAARNARGANGKYAE